MNLETLRTWSERLVALIRATLSRGVVRRVNDSRKLQTVQLEVGPGELQELEHVHPYGFTSRAFPGAEGVAAFMQANRDHGIVLVVADRRYRLTALEEGEVAIHDDQGQTVHLKRGGIAVSSPTVVEIDAPLTTVSGDLEVAGDVEVTGGVGVGASPPAPGTVQAAVNLEDAVGTVQAIRAAYNVHTHPETGVVTGTPTPTVP